MVEPFRSMYHLRFPEELSLKVLDSLFLQILLLTLHNLKNCAIKMIDYKEPFRIYKQNSKIM